MTPNKKSFLKASKKNFSDLENHQLHTVSRHCGYEMRNHHEALDDAYACAIIAIKLFVKPNEALNYKLEL